MDKAKINNLIETISSSLEQLKEALNDKKPLSIDDHRTVTIGKQTWLAENLRIDDGGEGIYFNEENSEYYYTWVAADRIAKSIPGWHLPNIDEWIELPKTTGDFDNAGKCLKSTTGWDNDGNGTDSFGFSVHPTGYLYIGSLYNFGSYAYFWTASEYPSSNSSYRFLFTGALMDLDYCDKSFAYPVRLVKDS